MRVMFCIVVDRRSQDRRGKIATPGGGNDRMVGSEGKA